jgi:hypothetical protein
MRTENMSVRTNFALTGSDAVEDKSTILVVHHTEVLLSLGDMNDV